MESSTVALQVKGAAQFTYDSARDQLSFNEQKKTFRACNDKGTEYFTLSCDKIPTEKGQTIKGNLAYTRGNGVGQESNLKLNSNSVVAPLV